MQCPNCTSSEELTFIRREKYAYYECTYCHDTFSPDSPHLQHPTCELCDKTIPADQRSSQHDLCPICRNTQLEDIITRTYVLFARGGSALLKSDGEEDEEIVLNVFEDILEVLRESGVIDQ